MEIRQGQGLKPQAEEYFDKKKRKRAKKDKTFKKQDSKVKWDFGSSGDQSGVKSPTINEEEPARRQVNALHAKNSIERQREDGGEINLKEKPIMSSTVKMSGDICGDDFDDLPEHD